MAEHTPAPTPNRAVYGFAWFLFFKTLFILYICWAFIPEHILEEQLGLTYLPDKYFALYLPILVLCALTIFTFLIYPPWNLAMQDDINDLHTIRDGYSIHRCQQLITKTGKFCEQKVAETIPDASNEYNIWKREKFCDLHRNETNALQSEKHSNENQMKNYCDCVDKSKCFLTKHPNHLSILNSRATVPSVCDLDISDVSKQFFRERKKQNN